MKADGTDKVRLTNDKEANFHPVWSKDGKWIYYQRNNDIYRMHPDGSNSQIVVKNGYHFDITWDSLKIVYVIKKLNQTSIMLRDLEKGRTEEIIPAKVPEFKGKDLAGPTISPDGKWLTFVSDYPAPWTLHIVKLDGRNRSRFASGCQPHYRPDGSWIVWILGGFHFVYIGTPDGKNQKLFEDSIPKRSHYYFPRWSNNGEYILFAASPRQNWNSDYEIYIKSFNRGKAVRLTFHPGSDTWPDLFIPDEKRNVMR
jgi:Tol biopolymer transport system component